jgi:type II secretory pathway predicted ATPase ExeA
MYKNHFKLERRLFRGNAAGQDVFVGPQTARIMSGIKKAITGTDGIASISGSVGCGKSTAVARSLAAISGKNAIVRIGRYPLQRGEVLDLLFDHMQIRQRPQRSNLKLSLFRQLLFNLAKNDARMSILVEDAPFLGPEILAELEVMTAADTGPSDGANIILMGDESLREFLRFKSLTRLRQRVRFRGMLEPCSVVELRGYLTHSMRQAGGDFGMVFAEGADRLLHELTGGILRVTNNLVEAALEAAADEGAAQVELDLITHVANEEFGLTGTFVTPPAMPDTTPEPRHADASTAELLALSMPGIVSVDAAPAQTETVSPESDQLTATAADPVALAIADAVEDIADESALEAAPNAGDPGPVLEPIPTETVNIPEDSDKDDIPELIQDTQPELPVLDVDEIADLPPEAHHDTLPNLSELSPELAAQAEALEALGAGTGNDSAPDKSVDPPSAPRAVEAHTPIPTLEPSSATPATDSSPLTQGPADGPPDWDREPTLAELRPDLEALERAMAVAQGRASSEPGEAVPVPVVEEPEAEEQDEPEGIPEITLDASINRKVDREALESQTRQEEETGVVEEAEAVGTEEELDAHRQEQADTELEQIAVGLAKAKSIEDVDDKMAETLFGEELSVAAAEVARMVAEEAADSECPTIQTAANDDGAPNEEEFENVWGRTPDKEISIESQFESQAAGIDVSASQRLATVRALNTESPRASPPPKAPAAKPEPIEEQITTSMTQTLKALQIEPAAINDDEDDEDQKRGFFSRFRRS